MGSWDWTGCEPIQGCVPSSGVNSLVIDLSDPQIKGPIEFIEAHQF